MAFHRRAAAARSSSEAVGSLSMDSDILSTGSRSSARLVSTGSSSSRGMDGSTGLRTTLAGLDGLAAAGLALSCRTVAGLTGLAGLATVAPVPEPADGAEAPTGAATASPPVEGAATALTEGSARAGAGALAATAGAADAVNGAAD